MESTPPRMLVAVTQRVDYIAARAERRDNLDQRIVNWLLRAGYLPVPVPNSLTTSCRESDGNVPSFESSLLFDWIQSVRPNALLLSGGNDIGEHVDRDITERYLLTWASRNRVPALGICRGLQMMGTWAGARLIDVRGHVNTRHRLNALEQAEGWPESVNSFHGWGLDSCPSDFVVAARADDGVIEAIKHAELPWEGWMWHPEREPEVFETDTARLKGLFRKDG